MSFPYNLKITYSSNESLPISTLESTHFIQDWSDIEIVARLLNSFSEKIWNVKDVKYHIDNGGVRFKDEYLILEVL